MPFNNLIAIFGFQIEFRDSLKNVSIAISNVIYMHNLIYAIHLNIDTVQTNENTNGKKFVYFKPKKQKKRTKYQVENFYIYIPEILFSIR